MRQRPLHCLIATSLLLACAAAAAAPALDAERPRWSALDYSAAKLFLSANTSLQLRLRPASELAAELRAVPQGEPPATPDQVLEVTYASRAAGHDNHSRLWVDPKDGTALQRMQSDRGSRLRERTYRFTDVGAWHFTRWPASRAEESLPPEQWTRVEQSLRAYPHAAVGQRITEATALLWIIAASPLTLPGDRLEVVTFSHREVSRVTVEVTGRRFVRAAFTEREGDTTRNRRGSIEALVLRLSATPLDPAGNVEDFELLGLRGDLELLLDPTTRAPIELRGRAKVVGPLTVRLAGMTLR